MTNRKNMCPICEMGILTAKVEKEFQTYKHATSELNLHYSECDVCCSQTATSHQLRQNKRAMIKFQKEVDGLLSATEVKQIRLLLGLSIKDAGAIFGGGPVAFSKYENDDLMQSIPMDSALRLARSTPSGIRDLAKARNITLLPSKRPAISTSLIRFPDSLSVTESIGGLSSSGFNSIAINFDNSPISKNIVEVYSSVH